MINIFKLSTQNCDLCTSGAENQPNGIEIMAIQFEYEYPKIKTKLTFSLLYNTKHITRTMVIIVIPEISKTQ